MTTQQQRDKHTEFGNGWCEHGKVSIDPYEHHGKTSICVNIGEEYFGYRIDLKELDKLPKKNSTHRTPADIESAMQEVEAKTEAYTDAHKGERDDDVLSQMRGESVCEDLEKEGKEWLRPQLDKSYANYGEAKMMELTHFDGYAMLEAIEFGAKWQKEQMMAKAVDATLLNGNLIKQKHTTHPLRVGDKVKVIVIKED